MMRQEAGLTQAALGRRAGYSPATVADAETTGQMGSLVFWRRCDTHLKANAALVAGYRLLVRAIARERQRAYAMTTGAEPSASPSRDFWARRDAVLGARGLLLASRRRLVVARKREALEQARWAETGLDEIRPPLYH
jgi:hypothetical protein